MGFSMGGWTWNTFSSYKPTANDYSYYSKITSMVNIQGVIPSDKYDSTLAYPQKFGNLARRNGFRMLGFEQVLDGRGIDGLTKNMNDSLAGSANFLWTNFGGSGHSNFNDFYNPSTTNWTLTNPDVQLSNGSGINSNPPAGGQNVYQWALRQGDTVLYSYSAVVPPVRYVSSTNQYSNTSISPNRPVCSITYTDGSTDVIELTPSGATIVSVNSSYSVVNGVLTLSVMISFSDGTSTLITKK
jgi:hypothetical protein